MPTTRSLALSTTSFIRVRALLPESVALIARKLVLKMTTAPCRSRASASVRPIVPISGVLKTAVGISV